MTSEFRTPELPKLPEGERWVVNRTEDPEDFEVTVSIVSGSYSAWDYGPVVHESGVCQPYASEIEMLAAELIERRSASKAVVGTYQVSGEMKRSG